MALASFAAIATMRVADPLLPQIAHEFDVTPGDAAIVSSAFTLAYAFGQFIYGPLGDRFGKLRIIAWMTVVSAFTISAAGLAQSLAALGLFRLIGGFTTAAIIPLAMAYIGDHVAYQDRQTVLARFLAGTVFGVILGQAFGGLVGDWLGWRAVFPILGGIMLVGGLLLLLERWQDRLPPPKLSGSLSLKRLGKGYATLFLDHWARIILLAVFVEGTLFYGAFTFIGADLHERFDISYGTVGIILSAFGLGSLVYTLMVKQLVTRLGEHGLALGGGLLLATGFACITALPFSTIPLGMFILGLGLSMLHNTLQTNATQMVPESRGLAVASFANCLFVGQALGIYAGGLLVDHAGFPSAYALAALGLVLLGGVLSRPLYKRSVIS